MKSKKIFVEPVLEEEFSLAEGTLGIQLCSGRACQGPA